MMSRITMIGTGIKHGQMIAQYRNGSTSVVCQCCTKKSKGKERLVDCRMCGYKFCVRCLTADCICPDCIEAFDTGE